jgi:Response regulator containing a CheY-like receiver domain and an HTH DNA-binding domain
MNVYKVLICDDHAVVRAGLRLILEKEKDFQIVGEAENAEQAIAQAARLHPDLVLMDISMPGMGGLEGIPRVRAAAPEARVMILTVHDDEAYFFGALEAGAAGYVLKGASVSELLAALRLVIHGGVPVPRTLGQRLVNDYLERVKNEGAPSYQQLSPREREVLRLVAKGRTNKEIAEQLSLSVRTVERHRSSIMNRIGLHNRAELVAYAVRQGFLSGGDIQPL